MNGIAKAFKAYNTSMKILILCCFSLTCGLIFNSLVFPKDAHLRETSMLLKKINKEITEGIEIINLMKISPHVSRLDNSVQKRIRSPAQKMKKAGKDREIGPKVDKMRAGTGGKIALEKVKTEKEIRYLNEILNITNGLNSWLIKQEGTITEDTKNEIRKLYFSLKKATKKKETVK